MTALVRGDARRIPLADESVDLIVTSPPYWSLRSYTDGGEHYDGQIGSEPTAQEFLETLWAVTAECWRVLKPTGSMWVNLGDKRSGSGAPGTTSGLTGRRSSGRPIPGQARVQGSRAGKRSYEQTGFGRPKSKMLLPHRYAIGCEDGQADPDGLGWIVRQDQVWSKPNGLPEPVTDRTRDTHEFWFHLTKLGDYFAAGDEIREPHTGGTHARRSDGAPPGKEQRAMETGVRNAGGYFGETQFNPLGRVPGSVRSVQSEAVRVPAHLEVEHFAAFPQEWPRWIIMGWSPTGWCTSCGSARTPVVEVDHETYRDAPSTGRPHSQDLSRSTGGGWNKPGYQQTSIRSTITGYGCECADASAPTRPAVVLDPFAGTGTTVMVARALGRVGIGLDLSNDYLRLARWRIFESRHAAKTIERTNRERQGVLL